MKTFFFVLAFLFLIKLTNGQNNHKADSLKHELRFAKEDTTKVKLYYDICWEYIWSYPDSALLYAASGLKLAQQLNFMKGQIRLMSINSISWGVKGNYSKELQSNLQILELAEKLNDPVEVAEAMEYIGATYYESGDYRKALAYYYKAKSNATLFRRDNSILSGFIGEAYFQFNNLDSAAIYIRRAYEADIHAKSHWSVPYYFMGKISEKNGDAIQAFNYYKKGIGFSSHILDKVEGYVNLASFYKNKGDQDSAIFFANKVILISFKSSLSSPLINASSILTAIYRAKHLPDSALKYQDIMIAAKDSAFSREKMKQMENFAFDEQIKQQGIRTKEEQYRSNVKMYALLGTVTIFLVIAILLWRNNRHKQKANEKIQKALAQLKATQTQLIQSEKMASLGELTAGIAHEIQNPLNFVNNFSEVSAELTQELKEELKSGNTADAIAIADDLEQNLGKIKHHGKRADAIVKGMLQHSQSGSGTKEPVNINGLADECMRLSYHGLRAKDKTFNAELTLNLDEALPKIKAIQQDLVRVMLNLFNNAFYAVNQKQKAAENDYKPEVSVTTLAENGNVIIKVKDNGTGIPDTIKEKIMQPFFTTKPTGEGTGLGLSLTYDMVVKGHGGSITVDTKEGEFTEFIVQLPL
jgi:signal transduction histidine kinase